MPAIDANTITNFLNLGTTPSSTNVQGKALEDLVCYLFGLVPGITITHRNALNAFNTEEIDVALWNECAPDGFVFLPNIILIECKNWSKPVGSIEVNWFDSKLRSRGLDFGILVSTLGITGDDQDLTAAHKVAADALKEKRRLVVLRCDEIQMLADTAELAHLVKTKLCDLAVKGTV
jgi:hypothetical protein